MSVVAGFQRSTCAFLPPDHWASSWDGGPRAGKANWQVMVIEISNKKGRDTYNKGHESLIAEAGRLSSMHISEPTRLRRIWYAVFRYNKQHIFSAL